MTLSDLMVATLFASNAWAGGTGGSTERAVEVCMEPGADAAVFSARAAASQIFAGIGVKVLWRNDPRACAAPNSGIRISLTVDTPADYRPGALAYAMPFERSSIVVFHDRVQAIGVQPLLAHVLVHEITHVLQGLSRHSAAGIMKSSWEQPDLMAMQRKPLSFCAEDIDWIRRAFDERAWASKPGQPARRIVK